MMTEVLTGKKKSNRLYYAKHAEKIKAQKRAVYAESKAANPASKTERPKPATMVSAKAETARTVRNRIEDILLAKELGVRISDL